MDSSKHIIHCLEIGTECGQRRCSRGLCLSLSSCCVAVGALGSSMSCSSWKDFICNRTVTLANPEFWGIVYHNKFWMFSCGWLSWYRPSLWMRFIFWKLGLCSQTWTSFLSPLGKDVETGMCAEHLSGSFIFLSVESEIMLKQYKTGHLKCLRFKQTILNLELMVCTSCLVKILPDASVVWLLN